MSRNIVLQSVERVKNKLINLTTFFVLFFFTLGFEVLSNLIFFGFFIFLFKKLKYNRELLLIIILLFFVLFPFYTTTLNNIYFKYWIFILRMLLLISVFNHLYLKTTNSFELRPILEIIFYIHVFCIIICYLSPSFNNIITNLFAFSQRETNFRISGFFSGFDIVSFFITVYLGYEYLGSGKVLTNNLLKKLLLGAFAIFQSGRFGVIPLAIFVFFLFIKFKNFKLIFLGIPIIMLLVASGALDNRIDNLISTVNMVGIAVKDLDQVDNSFFEGKEIEGQYNQSPLTWYFELIKPFESISDYLFPGQQQVVDSGPSFFILNFGLFLAISFYLIYFRIFKIITKKQIPFLVVAIFLVSDLKFRLLYSLMPLVWLTVNHFSYMQQLKNNKAKST